MLRDNFFYILLGFIAIILIGVTIGLQLMLLSGRSADEPSVATSASVAQPVEAESQNAATASDGQAVAMVINTPTSTPIIIAVESGDSSAAPISVEATATALLQPEPLPTEPPPTEPPPTEPPPTEPPPTEPPPTQVSAEIQPSEVLPTELPPTQIPSTATAVIVEPTSTPFLATDFVLGYVEGRSECVLVTNIVGDLLETWGWSTRLVQFASIADIFDATLYTGEDAMRPDLTFCYRDPEDRDQFLSQNGTDLELISSGYTQLDEQKYYILAHSSVPVQLRYENACVLNFLKDLDLSDTSFTATSSSQWLAENAVLVESWGTCTPTDR